MAVAAARRPLRLVRRQGGARWRAAGRLKRGCRRFHLSHGRGVKDGERRGGDEGRGKHEENNKGDVFTADSPSASGWEKTHAQCRSSLDPGRSENGFWGKCLSFS